MHKEVREILRIRFKLAVLDYAQGIGSVTKACREFEVPRLTFYEWKKAFDKEGKAGLARKKPIARKNHLVPGTLPWNQNFSIQRLPHPYSKRYETSAEDSTMQGYSHATLFQRSPRSSHPGRCQTGSER